MGGFKRLLKLVDRRVGVLSRERDCAFVRGDFSVYQNSCNELKGIKFVMERLKNG